MNKLLITNARLINEGEIRDADVLIEGERIGKIAESITAPDGVEVIDAHGGYLIPGMIDDQVHFREPGLTNKGDLATESAAAAAGGITSFMDMPNVNPQTTTRDALADKYRIAEARCSANYGFYLGGTNRNIEEIKSLEVGEACGIKVFMGASTGDMLVDDPAVLDQVFQYAPVMVVTHCEHSPTIWDNEADAKEKYGEHVPMSEHPNIRSAGACLQSSSMAVDLARRHNALLHILHLTTAIEMDLFSTAHRSEKRITAEVCVHHLWFDDSRYEDQGTRIKCNPCATHCRRKAAKLLQGTSRTAACATRVIGPVRSGGEPANQSRTAG
jgi:dihydroorotase